MYPLSYDIAMSSFSDIFSLTIKTVNDSQVLPGKIISGLNLHFHLLTKMFFIEIKQLNIYCCVIETLTWPKMPISKICRFTRVHISDLWYSSVNEKRHFQSHSQICRRSNALVVSQSQCLSDFSDLEKWQRKPGKNSISDSYYFLIFIEFYLTSFLKWALQPQNII